MEEIAKIEDDLGQAREDLRQTLNQISRKLGAIGVGLHGPERLIRRKPLAWAGGALAAGFLSGAYRRDKPSSLGFVLFGGLLGFAADKILNEFKRKSSTAG
ncbi:MAG TPA: hypothetical protein VKS22_10575 [Candidatus Binataceae bacterium]|nr:hypothetical protein [Candidatus Binataceae bacterium]